MRTTGPRIKIKKKKKTWSRRRQLSEFSDTPYLTWNPPLHPVDMVHLITDREFPEGGNSVFDVIYSCLVTRQILHSDLVIVEPHTM